MLQIQLKCQLFEEAIADAIDLPPHPTPHPPDFLNSPAATEISGPADSFPPKWLHFFYSFLRGSPAGLSPLMDPGSLALLPALLSLSSPHVHSWAHLPDEPLGLEPLLRVQLGAPP